MIQIIKNSLGHYAESNWNTVDESYAVRFVGIEHKERERK
jgi:hypothetical protein